MGARTSSVREAIQTLEVGKPVEVVLYKAAEIRQPSPDSPISVKMPEGIADDAAGGSICGYVRRWNVDHEIDIHAGQMYQGPAEYHIPVDAIHSVQRLVPEVR